MSALALGLVAALCWGIHDVTVRRISQTAPLLATLLGVLVVGSLFQVMFMTATGAFAPIPMRAVAYSVGAGLGYLLAGVCLYLAFQRGPVRIVAPILGSYPILSVALASIRGEPVTLWQWGAVLAVVGGIAAVSYFSHDTEEEIPPIGLTMLYSFMAAIGFFATFALGQEASRMAEDLPSILITRLTSIAFLLPVFPILSLPWWPGRKAIIFVVTMGVLDGIALICVLSAGSLPSAQFAAVASSTFGMITIILAWAFLRERMTAPQWGGCALAFAGIGFLAL